MTEYEITVVELEPTNALVLPRTVRKAEVGSVIGTSIDRAASVMNAALVVPNGPPFVRYRRYGEEVEMDVGFPVSQPQAVPSLRSTMLQGGPAATTWHEGSYSQLPAAFDAVADWIDDNGASDGSPWEIYWPAPDEGPTRIQVVWPIKRP